MSKITIVIASPRSGTSVEIVAQIQDAVQRIGSVVISDFEDARPRHAEAIVVVDGWGSTLLLRTAEHCQRYFESAVLLAIMNESSCTVSEVLDSGFDHCARWPIPPVEVAAWLRAALRRIDKSHNVAEIRLDALNLRVQCRGVEASLTRGQFGVLSELLRQPQRWVTSKELLAVNPGVRAHDTTQIRNHILALRRKLGTEAWRIRWHRSLGYFFDVSQPTAIAPVVRTKRGQK